MKNGSRDDASPLRHVCSHVRTDDVIVDVSSPLGAETREIVERGRTRNMVSKFELAGGSKVNMCGSGSRSFASGSHVENMQKIFDGESANTAAGKPLNISSGSPGIRSLVQRFDTAAASAGGRPSFGGPRQGRPVGREDWQTPGMDRASRSRSLAARWTATDVLPTKPRWMTSTKQASRVDDFVKQRQAESVSAAGADSASAWYRVVPATSVGCGQSQLDRRDAATAAANSSNVPAAAARRTPSINRRSASAHRNATRFDD